MPVVTTQNFIDNVFIVGKVLSRFLMKHLPRSKANFLTGIAAQQFKTGYEYKNPRMKDIQENEEFYYGRKIVVPAGRFGVPFPTMSGFVDTLMSKIDDQPIIKYGYVDLADLKLAKKTSLAFEKDSHPTRGNWPLKDRWAKKLACFSGRAIMKYFAESNPKYKSNLETVDHEDFVCEPAGGGDLENHMFCGQDNIFRTKAELQRGANEGLYDKDQVEKLIAATGGDEHKVNSDLWSSKKDRYKAFGLSQKEGQSTYMGQPIYRLVEWGMEHGGIRYYLLFDYISGIWIRAHLLKDVFESNLWPWTSWATHEDPFLFWSPGPCDGMRPIADTIDVLLNQALENREKRNMVHRAYDVDMFPDPSELDWAPDGLARATPKEAGKPISAGIYTFDVKEIGGTIDMVAFLDTFAGRKLGIVPEAQGAQDKDQKASVLFSNLEQMADRLGLFNKSYREFWANLGLRYAHGVTEHLRESEMIEMVGEEGIGWDKEKEKTVLLNIDISGGSAEVAANAAQSKEQENALALLLKRDDLMGIINKPWMVKKLLIKGHFEEADIRLALSREDIGDIEILAEAAQAIQDIVSGESPKLNRGANTAFMQKILDYAIDKDLKPAIRTKMMRYVEAHTKIAGENMKRKAMLLKVGAALASPEERQPLRKAAPPGIEVGEEPVAGPGKAISKGLQARNIFEGASPPAT